jgi:hypothetical protein
MTSRSTAWRSRLTEENSHPFVCTQDNTGNGESWREMVPCRHSPVGKSRASSSIFKVRSGVAENLGIQRFHFVAASSLGPRLDGFTGGNNPISFIPFELLNSNHRSILTVTANNMI